MVTTLEGDTSLLSNSSKLDMIESIFFLFQLINRGHKYCTSISNFSFLFPPYSPRFKKLPKIVAGISLNDACEYENSIYYFCYWLYIKMQNKRGWNSWKCFIISFYSICICSFVDRRGNSHECKSSLFEMLWRFTWIISISK